MAESCILVLLLFPATVMRPGFPFARRRLKAGHPDA